MSGHVGRRPAVVVGLVAALAMVLLSMLVARLWGAESEPVRDTEGSTDVGAEARVAVGERSDPAAGSAPNSARQRTEEGAADAAVAYTAASQRWLYMTDEQVTQAVEEIAAPANDGLVTDVVREMRAARERLLEAPARVWWLVRPLAWQVEGYGRDEASVAVWTVTVLAAAGVALPQSEWTTVTVDLAWGEGGWRVEAVDDQPGPTPMPGPGGEPWDPDRFDAELAGFTRLGGEEGA